MRLVKGFLVVSSVLFIIITLLSLLIPSSVKVSRTTLISGSRESVFSAVSNVKQWHYWHPALQAEGAVLTYCGQSADSISKCCDIQYNGKLTHLKVTASDSSSIKFTVQADGDLPIQNEITITPLKDANQLQVSWQSLTKLHWYPWEKFYAIFMDKLTGPGYEAALDGLKNKVEKESLHL